MLDAQRKPVRAVRAGDDARVCSGWFPHKSIIAHLDTRVPPCSEVGGSERLREPVAVGALAETCTDLPRSARYSRNATGECMHDVMSAALAQRFANQCRGALARPPHPPGGTGAPYRGRNRPRCCRRG